MNYIGKMNAQTRMLLFAVCVINILIWVTYYSSCVLHSQNTVISRRQVLRSMNVDTMEIYESDILIFQKKLAALYSVSNRTGYIPRIIHQSWKNTSLPPLFKNWSATWKSCFPDWKLNIWTDIDNYLFVRQKFPQYAEMFTKFKQQIYKIDTVRYLYMYEFGGIYTDLDSECLHRFDQLFADHRVMFGGMDYTGIEKSFPNLTTYVQNSFMVSAPKEPFWIELIERIRRKKQTTAGETTGPWVLMEVLNEYARIGYQLVKNFDAYLFNPWSWAVEPYPPGCLTLNTMTEANRTRCRKNFLNTSYVIQYHTQTWDRGKKNIRFG